MRNSYAINANNLSGKLLRHLDTVNLNLSNKPVESAKDSPVLIQCGNRCMHPTRTCVGTCTLAAGLHATNNLRKHTTNDLRKHTSISLRIKNAYKRTYTYTGKQRAAPGHQCTRVVTYDCNDASFEQFGTVFRIMQRMHVSAEEIQRYILGLGVDDHLFVRVWFYVRVHLP